MSDAVGNAPTPVASTAHSPIKDVLVILLVNNGQRAPRPTTSHVETTSPQTTVFIDNMSRCSEVIDSPPLNAVNVRTGNLPALAVLLLGNEPVAFASDLVSQQK